MLFRSSGELSKLNIKVELNEVNVLFDFVKSFMQLINLAGAMALGLTGPCVRAAGYPLDMRRLKPYCGYEDYDFDVPVYDRLDCTTACACASTSATSP